jgi:hypothetical protein
MPRHIARPRREILRWHRPLTIVTRRLMTRIVPVNVGLAFGVTRSTRRMMLLPVRPLPLVILPLRASHASNVARPASPSQNRKTSDGDLRDSDSIVCIPIVLLSL